MKDNPFEHRFENMERDIKYIRSLVEQMHETLKMTLQSHADERIMSAKEVADFLNIDINLIYSKCSKGELPFFKAGKLIKFKKTEIITWMRKQNRTDPGSIDSFVHSYLQKTKLKG
jgi:excisionase family DNA binding protein